MEVLTRTDGVMLVLFTMATVGVLGGQPDAVAVPGGRGRELVASVDRTAVTCGWPGGGGATAVVRVWLAPQLEHRGQRASRVSPSCCTRLPIEGRPGRDSNR